MTKRIASLILLLLLTGCIPQSEPPQIPAPAESAAGKGQSNEEKWALTSVSMMTESEGWGIGSGKLLRTTDGGSTWLEVTPSGLTVPDGPSPDQAPGYFRSGKSGWVAVESGRSVLIYRTADGGKTWQTSSLETAGSGWTQLHFASAEDGWMLVHQGVAMGSEQVEVLRTRDGGTTWTRIAAAEPSQTGPGALPFGGLKKGISFRDPARGWVTAEDRGPGNGRLYQTKDGGQTWSKQELPLPGEYQSHSLTIYPPRFFDEKNGVMPVTFVPGYDTIFWRTEDGGSTWTATDPTKASPITTSVAYDFFDPDHGWSTDGERVYITVDGGGNWESITPGGNLKGIKQLDFVSPTVGWALSESGLAKTEDGGRTWRPLDESGG